MISTRAHVISAVIWGLSLLGASSASRGDTNAGSSVYGSARVVSDYVYRSYSRSGDKPAVQGQVSMRAGSRGFVGFGVSSVDLGDAAIEASPYVGVTLFSNDDWRAIAMAAGYLYNQEVATGRAGHFVEPSASLFYRGMASIKAGVAADLYGFGRSVPYLEVAGSYPVSDVTKLGVGLGYEHMKALSGADYAYWNAGATHYFSPHWAIDLRYHGTSGANHGGEPASRTFFEPIEIGNRLILSVSFGF
jgi:uncharacterized protein (TIGR02001 family)